MFILRESFIHDNIQKPSCIPELLFIPYFNKLSNNNLWYTPIGFSTFSSNFRINPVVSKIAVWVELSFLCVWWNFAEIINSLCHHTLLFQICLRSWLADFKVYMNFKFYKDQNSPILYSTTIFSVFQIDRRFLQSVFLVIVNFDGFETVSQTHTDVVNVLWISFQAYHNATFGHHFITVILYHRKKLKFVRIAPLEPIFNSPGHWMTGTLDNVSTIRKRALFHGELE